MPPVARDHAPSRLRQEHTVLSETINVTLTPDPDGYLGRECPACKRYFKVLPGTGLTGQQIAYCPYCKQPAPPANFATRAQVEYAKSIALRQFQEQLRDKLKQIPEVHTTGPISIHMTITTSDDEIPIEHYQDPTLETSVTCGSCTLQYKTYGVFATCPDCGTHNSRDILMTNLTLLRKQLDDADDKQREDLLKNAVATFDAFGRASTEHDLGTKISFQNLRAAEEQLQKALCNKSFLCKKLLILCKNCRRRC